MTIEAQWQALETESRSLGDDGWRLRLARPVGGHPLFAATSGRRRVLLLRGAAAAIPPRADWPVCTGLEMLAVTLDGHAYLGVALREPRFADVFAALAEDLARRIEKAVASGASGVAVFLGQLRRWQRFLAIARDGLDPAAQRGLWGELHFLKYRLLPPLGGAAVDGWKGPDGAHQDFQFAGAWIEVKTTLAKQPQSVRIASERQLDETRAPALFLHVLALEAHEGGAATLPAAIADLRAALTAWPAARETFEEKLLAAGYLDQHAPRYDATGYAVRLAQDFRVQGDFPRIVEAALPAGIGEASYSLSLAACAGFAAAETEIAAALAPVAAAAVPAP
jgi:hypothetical protein